MNKKILALSLAALTAVGVSACGTNDNKIDDGNQTITGVTAGELKEAKATLKTYFDNALSELKINATSKYYGQLEKAYNDGLKALEEASTPGVLTQTVRNYQQTFQAHINSIKGKIEDDKLVEAKELRINALVQTGEMEFLKSGINVADADDSYKNEILPAAEKIITDVKKLGELDKAFNTAKAQLIAGIQNLLSNSTVVIEARNKIAAELKKEANDLLAAKGLIDDGQVYAEISIALDQMTKTQSKSKMESAKSSAISKINTLIGGNRISQSLNEFVTGKALFANKFENNNTVVDCVGQDELSTNVFDLYGQNYQYSQSGNKGTITYNNDYDSTTQISVGQDNGLYLDDNSEDDDVKGTQGFGLKTILDIEDVKNTNYKAFRLHFDIKMTESSSWSVLKLLNDQGSQFELGSSESDAGKLFGYRFGNKGNRLTIGETGISNKPNEWATIDTLFDFAKNKVKITVTKGAEKESIVVDSNLSLVTKIEIDGNGSSARDLMFKNFVVSASTEAINDEPENPGTSLEDVKAQAIINLQNAVNDYFELNNKADDGTVSPALEEAKTNINACTSIEAVNEYYNTSLASIKEIIDQIEASSGSTTNVYTLTYESVDPSLIENDLIKSETVIENTPFTLLPDTLKGIDLKNRISLSAGSVKKEKNAVKIVVDRSCLITVNATATKTTAKPAASDPAKVEASLNNAIRLIKEGPTSDTNIDSADYAVLNDVTDAKQATYSFYVEAGTYYLGGAKSGIYLYSLTVDYTKTAEDVVEPSLELMKANYKAMLLSYARSKYDFTGSAFNPTVNADIAALCEELYSTIDSATTNSLAKAAYAQGCTRIDSEFGSVVE